MISHARDNAELARIYDRLSERQFQSGRGLFERLGLEPGARVLDIGCGTGRLAQWIAARIGPNVVGIDPLPDRIALARERAPALRFEVGRAEDLSVFASESFDAICLSAVFHWVEDKARALGEMVRLLRPGGRVGLTTQARELRPQGTLAEVIRPMLQRPPYLDRAREAGAALGAATLTEMVTLLHEASLSLRELHVSPNRQHLERGEDVIAFLESSTFGNFLAYLPDDLRIELRQELVSAFDARRGPEGIVIEDFGVLAVAERRERRGPSEPHR
ncbi:MAG TPA: methyltransferase domain-containing protein [Anaeromyxobacter sp.]|nr:methyltransferase domain-containing protein [Anaeromyxobacter sp.]